MASSIVDARAQSSLAARMQTEAWIGGHDRPAVLWRGPFVETWSDFREHVASRAHPLLARLDDYDDSLLIAGCDWPSTTAVARLLKRSTCFADHGFGHDDELDGALLLAGYVTRFSKGRHCFQSTYLHDRYREYFDHEGFRLIWILREPRAVVSSMLNRWKRLALDAQPGDAGEASTRGGLIGASRLDKACAAYAALAKQAFELHARLGRRIAIVDYDELTAHRDEYLPQLCAFARVPFEHQLLSHLHGKSVHKGHTLAAWEAARVDELAAPAYLRARALCAAGGAHAG
jgi:hypothetical protein